MSGQPQLFEGAASLEKHALATVLDFIKKRNLKETEEALKKELGISASTISPASGQLPFSVTAGIHSVEIDPEKLDESYSRPRPSVVRRAVNASLSVSEDRSESPFGSDSEEEGPKSWPGKFSSGMSSTAQPIGLYRPLGASFQFPSFGVGQVPTPMSMTTATTTTPSPPAGTFAFKPSLVPTLFTIVPRGLIPGAPAIPSGLVSSVAGIPPPLVDSSALPPTSSVPMVSPSSPSPSPTEEVSSPTSCLPSSTTFNKTSSAAKGPVTLASIPPEEMTPAYAQLRAFAEEFKTKRIQLGYTQGAVGQSLAERGYSNFAQSTISRFEQMQLSASNAATIKQILERWLHETEHPEDVSSSTESVIPPRKRKKRAVFTSQTRTSLEDYFRQEARPSRQLIETIANELDLLPEEVRVWFCNKRQKFKQQTAEDVSLVSHGGPGSPSTPVVIPSSPDLATAISKKRSPSPPHPNFSIEELSKSSSSTTTITNSPVRITSQLSFSPPRTFCPIILPSQRPNISVPTSFINPFSSTKA